MFHLVAASFLFHSINNLKKCDKKQNESLVKAIPGLSLNNNLLNQGKNLRRLLEDSPLKEKKVVVWHDVVNNTISSHRTNNYLPAGVEELTNFLKSKKQQILAIVYCRREGTPDFFSQLLGTGVLIIPATKRLLSKSKQNDPQQLKEYLKLHQSAELELKSLRLVVAHKEKGVRADRQYQGQTTETITDKEEGESKTWAEAEGRGSVCASKTGVRRGWFVLLCALWVSFLVACKTMTTVLLPALWLRQNLTRKLTWKLVLDYLKFFKKVQVSVHRLKFLRKCLKNDLIPDFLKFRVPENGFFSDQAETTKDWNF